MNRIQLVAIGMLTVTALGLGGITSGAQEQTVRQAQTESQSGSSLASKRRLPMPPDKGIYRTSQGGGTRTGPCDFPMDRLVPKQFISAGESNVDVQSRTVEKERVKDTTTGGFTVAARPSFWAYVPNAGSPLKALSFELQNHASGEVQYETQLALPKASGMIEIQLPQTAPELEFDQTYRWFLTAAIDCEGSSIESELDGGWIQRYQPDAELAQQLAVEAEDYELYQDKGLWFDALRLLGNQRQQQPDTAGLAQKWTELLELYGLGVWAQEQLSECCEAVEGDAIARD